MVQDVWHFGLVVGDIDRAIAFYTNVLGLELRHRQEQENPYTSALVGYPDASLRVAQLRIPGRQSGRSGHFLELIEYVRPTPEPVRVQNATIGAAHLAFEVSAISALRPALESAGATFVSEPVEITAGINRGGRAVYLRDPDGFTLELVEPPRLSE